MWTQYLNWFSFSASLLLENSMSEYYNHFLCMSCLFFTKLFLAPIAYGQLAAMMLGEFISRKKHIISDYTSYSSLFNLVYWNCCVLLEKPERQHFHANGWWAHVQLILSLCLMENLGQVGIAKCSLRNTSIWKRANALVFVSTRANCQLRFAYALHMEF